MVIMAGPWKGSHNFSNSTVVLFLTLLSLTADWLNLWWQSLCHNLFIMHAYVCHFEVQVYNWYWRLTWNVVTAWNVMKASNLCLISACPFASFSVMLFHSTWVLLMILRSKSFSFAWNVYILFCFALILKSHVRVL